MTGLSKLQTLKWTLTLSSMEFFGPALRDSDISHLQNPDWPGHAKLHMMWFIAYLAYTGFIQIYLIWFKKDKDYSLILGWQLSNICAFWSAVILAPFYGGAVIDGKYHVEIFGINENIVAFTLFSSLWLFSLYIYKTIPKSEK